MAMFLSRIKQILNLGTKSITANGTYNASTDGYDGYSSVEVNVPQITPTSITPSNSSPVALTADSPVTPTTAGYAIRGYDRITPSNSLPVYMNQDGVFITNNDGYAIESMSSVTPSDYAPPRLFQGGIYKLLAHGYLYSSQQVVPTSIVPSDSSPVALTSGTPVNPMANGYAISSYSSKTPSDSSPASVSSGAIIKASASGYLISSNYKIKTGSVTLSTSTTTTVNCGFQPKYIALVVYKDTTHFNQSIYNKDISTSYTYRSAKNGNSTAAAAIDLPTTSSSGTPSKILSISNTGFTIDVATTTAGTSCYYFAIG